MLARTIALSIFGLLLAAPAANAKTTWQDQPSGTRVTVSGVLVANHAPRARSPRDGRGDQQARRFGGDRHQGQHRGEVRRFGRDRHPGAHHGQVRRFGGDRHPGAHQGQVRRFDRDWRRGRQWRGPRGRFDRRYFRRMPPRHFYGRRGPGRPYFYNR